jgi:hypothetical protein
MITKTKNTEKKAMISVFEKEIQFVRISLWDSFFSPILKPPTIRNAARNTIEIELPLRIDKKRIKITAPQKIEYPSFRK